MTFLSALLLGLLASAHCAGMCGGLQSVLQPSGVIRSNRDASAHLLALNLGRLSTYIAAGAVFSLLGLTVINAINVPQITQAARFLTAFVLLMLGLQMLVSNSKPFAWAERFGATLWQTLSQRLHNNQNSRVRHSYVRGLAWGFLPCGLVYGVLFTTLFSDSLLRGTQVMLGFGLGTLPAMLLTGGLYQSLRKLVRNRAVQWGGGLLFIQGGVLMLLAPWLIEISVIDTSFMQTYPQVMSSMFCISQ